MDFFTAQETAHRKTGLLLVYFAVAVLLIICSVYLAILAGYLFVHCQNRAEYCSSAFHYRPERLVWNEQLFLVVTSITFIIVVLGSLYKMLALSGGGSVVAQMLGGRLVQGNTREANERKILNVVEEMAIAAGISVPPVYILENEPGINAFAAGFSPKDAVIGVTRGSVEKLSRDELQGVIGHEFSHILNGDMRLNIRLIGILNGILVIALAGYTVLRVMGQTRTGGRNKDGRVVAAVFLVAACLMVVGYVGVFFGKLIKSAISREREYLADASSVQFTRNPRGLASALAKIARLSFSGSRIETNRAEEASHMFFANGLKASFFQLMATHPPLLDRIQRIDPSFEISAETEAALEQGPEEEETVAVSSLQGAPQRFSREHFSPQAITAQVGSPNAQHISYAKNLLASIPAAILDQLREPYGARAAVFTLLLDSSKEAQDKQLNYLSKGVDETIFKDVVRLMPEFENLSASVRISLIDVAIPALKTLSPVQYQAFKAAVAELIQSDNNISLFEYMLQRILDRQLDSAFNKVPVPAVKYNSLYTIFPSCVQVLSTLARLGNDDEKKACTAFDIGLRQIGEGFRASILPPENISLTQLDQALTVLCAAAPMIKRRVLEASVACITADEQITLEEAELIRTIGSALDCPIPPFVASPSVGG